MPCLFILAGCLSLTAVEATPFSGLLDVLLEEAVPFTGLKNGGADLHLSLAVNDGRVAERGWAYMPVLAAVDHPVQVVRQQRDGPRLELELRIAILGQFPYYEGGSAAVSLTIQKYGRSLRGAYACTTEPWDEAFRRQRWTEHVGIAYDERMVRGRLERGTRFSRSEVPGSTSHGTVEPVILRGSLQPAPPAMADLRGAAHPRCLDLPSFRAGSETTHGRRWTENLRALLAGDDPGGALAAGDALPCHGFHAAGQAARLLLGDDADDACIVAVEACLAEGLQRGADHRWRYARELAGLSLAFDLAAERWPAELRRRVADRLAAEAWHCSGLAMPSKDAAFLDNGVIGSPSGPGAINLGLIRCAATLAATVVLGEDLSFQPVTELTEPLVACWQVHRRGAARFLRDAFGSSGAPLGHAGSDEIVELCFPVAQAVAHAAGVDLHHRGHGPLVGRWAMQTGGAMFDNGPAQDGPWAPLLAAAMPAADLPLAAWYIAEEQSQVVNPWQAIWAIAGAPRYAAVSPAARHDRILEDQASGALVVQSDPTGGPGYRVIVETAQGGPLVAGAVGRISVAGCGREWIQRPRHPSGDLASPDYQRQNVLAVKGNSAARQPPVVPIAGSQVQRVRVAPDLSGASIGFINKAWREAKRRRDGAYQLEEIPGKAPAQTWTTIGIDTSGASGAELALVIVAGYHGFNDRPVAWQLDIGDLPESAVRFDNQSFTVRPSGSDATMVGTVVYPPSMRFEYQPPADGLGARISTWMEMPPTNMDEAFLDSLYETAFDLSQVKVPDSDAAAAANSDIDELSAELDALLTTSQEDQSTREHTGQQVKTKILRVTTSNKMGSPYLKKRVHNHIILTLSIQRDEAPAIAPRAVREVELLDLGEQVVQYWEFLVEFHRGMRESIRAYPAR